MLIVCNGMIRSGTTLQYHWVSQLIKPVGGVAEGFFQADELAINEKRLNEWIENGTYHLIKTHAPLAHFIDNPKVKILFTHRDPRDIAVSAKRSLNLEGDDIIALLDEQIESFKAIATSQTHCLQPFNQLQQNPINALMEIADFLDIESNKESAADILAQVEARTSLEHSERKTYRQHLSHTLWKLNKSFKLKQRLLSLGFPESLWVRARRPFYAHNKELLHTKHISNPTQDDTTGNTQSDLVKKIQFRYAQWMQENGYQ